MSLKKRSKVFIAILILAVLGGVIGYKIAYKPHAKIQDLGIEYTGTASSLVLKISESPETWQNKIVQISGVISDIETKGFMLNGNVYCQKDKSFKTPKALKDSESYTIKGRVIGYDDLLEELKLDQVILVK